VVDGVVHYMVANMPGAPDPTLRLAAGRRSPARADRAGTGPLPVR
jgi:hypothetical protein